MQQASDSNGNEAKVLINRRKIKTQIDKELQNNRRTFLKFLTNEKTVPLEYLHRRFAVRSNI